MRIVCGLDVHKGTKIIQQSLILNVFLLKKPQKYIIPHFPDKTNHGLFMEIYNLPIIHQIVRNKTKETYFYDIMCKIQNKTIHLQTIQIIFPRKRLS